MKQRAKESKRAPQKNLKEKRKAKKEKKNKQAWKKLSHQRKEVFRDMASLPQDMQPQETDRTNGSVSGNEGKTPMEFRSIALKGLFIIVFFYTLYFARALVLPFTLALLFNFLLRPVVRALKRARIPESVGAALVLIVLLGSVGYGAVKLSIPAAQWIDRAPESLRQIELKVSFLRKPIEGANKAVEELKRVTRMGAEKKPEVEIKTPGITEAVLTGTREVIVKSSVMFILLYFLLASGDLFLGKFIKLYPKLHTEKRDPENHTSRGTPDLTIPLYSDSDQYLHGDFPRNWLVPDRYA